MYKSSQPILLVLAIFLLLASCTEQKSQQKVTIGNPGANGFNIKYSDAKAIKLADESMVAMGGRQAYDATRYIAWNFFGSRKHVWDKHTGDVYINNLRDNYELKMNIHDMKGKMIRDGNEVTHPDSLSKYLTKGKEMWINDAYWLVMPYKLKDSGVTLNYIGEDKTTNGIEADILQLTFEDVGVTPENKYHVYIDKKTKLVSQWDFFTTFNDKEPRFSTPWDGYKDYNGIQLCGGRGKNSLTEIEVSESLSSYFE